VVPLFQGPFLERPLPFKGHFSWNRQVFFVKVPLMRHQPSFKARGHLFRSEIVNFIPFGEASIQLFFAKVHILHHLASSSKNIAIFSRFSDSREVMKTVPPGFHDAAIAANSLPHIPVPLHDTADFTCQHGNKHFQLYFHF
jgi:hypothetical protein